MEKRYEYHSYFTGLTGTLHSGLCSLPACC